MLSEAQRSRRIAVVRLSQPRLFAGCPTSHDAGMSGHSRLARTALLKGMALAMPFCIDATPPCASPSGPSTVGEVSSGSKKRV
jgi:hypothetical protein